MYFSRGSSTAPRSDCSILRSVWEDLAWLVNDLCAEHDKAYRHKTGRLKADKAYVKRVWRRGNSLIWSKKTWKYKAGCYILAVICAVALPLLGWFLYDDYDEKWPFNKLKGDKK